MKSTEHMEILLEQKSLAEAAELARAGRYLEAESLLSGLLHGKDTSILVLDLLARIRAQQGRLAEAESLWKQGLQADPSNESCLAGLHRVAQMQKPVWIASGGKILAGAIAMTVFLLCIGGIMNAVYGLRAEMRDEAERTAVVQKQTMEHLSDLRETQSALSSEVKSLLSQAEANRPDKDLSPGPLNLPDIAVNVPGVQLSKEKDKILISFESGLFGRGTRFRPEVQDRLTLVGNQLALHKDLIALHVTGYTDDLPMPSGRRYLDNTSLGLDRALAVIEHLRSSAGLSGVPFTASGEVHVQHPGSSFPDRLRNRTVTINVLPIRQKEIK